MHHRSPNLSRKLQSQQHWRFVNFPDHFVLPKSNDWMLITDPGQPYKPHSFASFFAADQSNAWLMSCYDDVMFLENIAVSILMFSGPQRIQSGEALSARRSGDVLKLHVPIGITNVLNCPGLVTDAAACEGKSIKRSMFTPTQSGSGQSRNH